MTLTNQDAKLFFELMWGLQWFVNRETGIHPELDTPERYGKAHEEKHAVRDKLFENPQFIKQFVAENPLDFDAEKLGIVNDWQHFIEGSFYIERYLKKYAVFIQDGEKGGVYAVLGLYDPLEEIIPDYALPYLVKTVLLPFKDVIVYDGLLQGYNIHFGGGIKRNLKEMYRRAKQNGRIITSLTVSGTTPQHRQPPAKALQDWLPEIDAMIEKSKKLRGGQGQPPVYSPAFSLLRANLELTRMAVATPEDKEALWHQVSKVEAALEKLSATVDRLMD